MNECSAFNSLTERSFLLVLPMWQFRIDYLLIILISAWPVSTFSIWPHRNPMFVVQGQYKVLARKFVQIVQTLVHCTTYSSCSTASEAIFPKSGSCRQRNFAEASASRFSSLINLVCCVSFVLCGKQLSFVLFHTFSVLGTPLAKVHLMSVFFTF